MKAGVPSVFTVYFLLLNVFSLGGQTAPDVALGFVLLQKLPDLGVEGRGGPGEHLAEVLVDRGFGEGEVLSGGTDGAACLDHVRRQSAGTVVFVAGHGSTS